MVNDSNFDITVPFYAKNKRRMDIVNVGEAFHLVLVNHDVHGCVGLIQQ